MSDLESKKITVLQGGERDSKRGRDWLEMMMSSLSSMPFTSAGFHLSQREETRKTWSAKCAFCPYMGIMEWNDTSEDTLWPGMTLNYGTLTRRWDVVCICYLNFGCKPWFGLVFLGFLSDYWQLFFNDSNKQLLTCQTERVKVILVKDWQPSPGLDPQSGDMTLLTLGSDFFPHTWQTTFCKFKYIFPPNKVSNAFGTLHFQAMYGSKR